MNNIVRLVFFELCNRGWCDVFLFAFMMAIFYGVTRRMNTMIYRPVFMLGYNMDVRKLDYVFNFQD